MVLVLTWHYVYYFAYLNVNKGTIYHISFKTKRYIINRILNRVPQEWWQKFVNKLWTKLPPTLRDLFFILNNTI